MDLPIRVQSGPMDKLESDFKRSAVHAEKILSGVRKRIDVHFADRVFFHGVRLVGILVGLVLLFIAGYLTYSSLPAIKVFGAKFAWGLDWDPVRESFGALPVIYGTLISSFVALIFAAPISVGIALFLNELAPGWLSRITGFLVEMLAAIPSVVYGLWGIFVLAPWLRSSFQPWVIQKLGFIPFFAGPPYGVGMFAAGVILSIMILPTISSLSLEVFRAIPRGQREAALALGSTRWEMMKLSVLQSSKAGVSAAIFLGLGRALGETMAVTMVIGNRSEILLSLFAPAQTMASVIANEYAEATSDVHLAALAEIGLLLFGVTFIINAVARVVIWRVTRGVRA